MRVFVNKPFARFAGKADISRDVLCGAVRRAEAGLIDADLGGGVIKQRIARPGQGRSGSYRTVVLFRRAERAFFVYGYAKTEIADIAPDDLKGFRRLAALMLVLDDADLARVLATGTLTELDCHA